LTLAAAMIASQPAALQLRTLQTLVEISAERSNTIVFPIPIELLPRSGDAASAATSATVSQLASAAATAIAAARARDKDGERDPALPAAPSLPAELPPGQASELRGTSFEQLKAQFEALLAASKKG
jgi:hypothetical protein